MIKYCNKQILDPEPHDWGEINVPIQIDIGDLHLYKFMINDIFFDEDSKELQDELSKANTWIILNNDRI